MPICIIWLHRFCCYWQLRYVILCLLRPERGRCDPSQGQDQGSLLRPLSKPYPRYGTVCVHCSLWKGQHGPCDCSSICRQVYRVPCSESRRLQDILDTLVAEVSSKKAVTKATDLGQFRWFGNFIREVGPQTRYLLFKKWEFTICLLRELFSNWTIEFLFLSITFPSTSPNVWWRWH